MVAPAAAVASPPADIDSFLATVRLRLMQDTPELLPLFDTLAQEARAARDWLGQELGNLPRGASILEVGGGALLLSCQLAREGFAVTAVDPLGDGFSAFGKLRARVLDHARSMGPLPRVAECAIEHYEAPSPVDLAFSFNAMEHVENVDAAIESVAAALKPGAAYRFLCPNYLFPYEPHFNIPTLFSKRLTEIFFRRSIIERTDMPDAAGLWRSLNWITVPAVRRIAKKHSLAVHFRTDVTARMMARLPHDAEFSARRSGWMNHLVRLAVGWRLHRLASAIPPGMQPVMDCRLTKKSLP